jgi:hypothetical protein
MDVLVDKAIKHPFEMINREHPVLVDFSKWLKRHVRHEVPITFKSEWAIASAIQTDWPRMCERERVTKVEFRSKMLELVRMMRAKQIHRHYVFQMLVHFEEFMFGGDQCNALSFWTNIFVQQRTVDADELKLCERFDDFIVCELQESDESFFRKLCLHPLVKRVKMRQLAVLISFGRSEGLVGTCDTILRLGLWMDIWRRLGEAHASGPSYWCQVGDNVKHMLKMVCAWDQRHNMSHRLIKMGIREKNVHLTGRSMMTRHQFVTSRGERFLFDQGQSEVKMLKRRLEDQESALAGLRKQASINDASMHDASTCCLMMCDAST